MVQFYEISTEAKTNTGFTDVNSENPTLIFNKTLNIGHTVQAKDCSPILTKAKILGIKKPLNCFRGF